MSLIKELNEHGATLIPDYAVLDISKITFERWCKNAIIEVYKMENCIRPRPKPKNKLSKE